MIILAFMLLISFSAIIAFKQTSIKYNAKFPHVDCKSILGENEDLNLKAAGLEYLDQIDTEGTAPLNGAMQCFCDEKAKKDKLNWFKNYSNDYSVNDVRGD